MNASTVSKLTSGNRLLYILGGGIAIVVFLVFILILRNIGGSGSSGAEVDLAMWGIFDPPEAFDVAIQEFEAQHPNIKIQYQRIPTEDYEQQVLNAFASNTGPDIWMANSTWIPKDKNKIRPLPQETLKGMEQPIYTLAQFKNDFVDVAYRDLVVDNQILALPLYVDTLALYYNKDMLSSAGIPRPAQNWDEFNAHVERLAQVDAAGNVLRSAAAVGTAKNINRSTDILAALMLQSGVQMTSNDHSIATFARGVDGKAVGETALEYYTDFANPLKRTYTWNDAQHYSIDAFVNGETAMMFNYSHQIPTVKERAPHLNFGVASLPQVNEQDKKNYASYWAPTVSVLTPKYVEAWEFLAYLASHQGALSYLSATSRPAARFDILELQQQDQDLGVFATQALSARSWYQIDNAAVENTFAQMIDDVNYKRRTPHESIQYAETQVNVLMHNIGK